MKLHLPSVLRKALLLVLAAVSATLGIQSAAASLIFDGVGIQTYADFGQNCGRYVAGEVNDMLQAIRKNEKGIVIRYEGGAWKDTIYTIPLDQGMIDFSSASSNPVDAAVGYGFLATVAHNGVLSPTYSALEVGDKNAIRYNSIDFRRGGPFHLESNTDFKMARLNKLVTDVQPSEFYSGADPSSLNGKYLYRTGSGAMDLGLVNEKGNWSGTQEMDLPYSFATGGIVTIEWADNPTHAEEHDANFGIFHHFNNNIYTEITGKDFQTHADIATPNPLPYRVRSGDSGSPTWVYNEKAKAYQYISAGQSGGTYFSQDRGDLEWSEYTLTKFNVTANLGTTNRTITIKPVTVLGKTIEGVGEEVEVSTTLHYGSMQFTDASGETKDVQFVGVEKDKHTWLDLTHEKDKVNWFNYGDEYFNVSKYKTDDKEFCFADMFETNNLAFEAGDNGTYNIVLEDNVDLGVGFVQFSKGENFEGQANFSLKSNDFVLDSAGFAIDKDVTLELDMKAPEKRMVEWRKAGAGNLTITGTGETNALLNVGGSGTVSLKRTGGYAAYNVLASSGSTLVIDNLQQVYRDVTLGAGGATLDLNGNNFTWNNAATPDGSGFKSLHLLVEKDVVTNKASKAIQITIKDPGAEAFVGAFKDTKDGGAIHVVYEGAADREWVMNTVFTNLQNNDASDFTVKQGSVVLQGINTVHGRQRLGKRIVNDFDWHYADAKMDVVVENDAVFTLGSHARLKGDVTVKDGGAFTMTEYTTHREEYLEGGVVMDDTYKYREYFGLHGNLNLVGEDSMFYVQFTPQHHYQDTDSESLYKYRIYGSGGMMVNTAGGSLRLTNVNNDFSGLKILEGGTLVASAKEALGDTSQQQWEIQDRGILIVENTGISEILPMVDKASTGVLALTQNVEEAVNLSNHQQLIIGAVGKIQFGEENTQTELKANEAHEWHLGGGGGELYVNYRLNDAAGVLVLGNQYTTGKVFLTNTQNNFRLITLMGGVTLDYTNQGALGNAQLSLKYGNRILGTTKLIGQLTEDSDGVVLLDKIDKDATLNLSGHKDLSLSAEGRKVFSGTITLDADDDTYNLGGGGGHLTLDTVLTDGPGKEKRNVLVDGQFFQAMYSEDGQDGGVIELTKALQLTGDVTVQGFDVNRIPEADPLYVFNHFSTVTLQLSAENALENVGSIILKDGGFIDVNGTKQTLNSLLCDVDDLYWGLYGFTDNSEKQTGELVLNVTSERDSEFWSPVFCNLLVPKLTKTGDGTLYMQNVTESPLFTIEGGKVVIWDDQALNSQGVTHVKDSGILDLSELEADLEDKNILLSEGGTLLVGSNAVDCTVLVDSGRGVIEQVEGAASTSLSGIIDAAPNATLELKGTQFCLNGPAFNTDGGTIDLQAKKLTLAENGEVSIGGTLNVSSNATLANASTTEVSRTIARVNVDGQTLTIENNKQSAHWNIGVLDGSGTVVMQVGNTGSALLLEGSGSFKGEIQVQGGTDTAPGLILAHDTAAQYASINLQDKAAMELTTGNTVIAGLKGTQNARVYTAVEGATLTTTGNENYTFSGSIGGSGETRLNLVHKGSGQQTYNGSLTVNNITVQNGELSLNVATLDYAGNVTVARGSTLSTTNGNLTLNDNHFLCSSGAEGNAGTLSNTITFNGGGMLFDVAGQAGSTNAALDFRSGVKVTGEKELAVHFINASALTIGSSLTLANGYNAHANPLVAKGVDYLTAKFSVTDNVLSVTFEQKEGYCIWDGTTEQHAWSTTSFGQKDIVPQTSETAVFNDSATGKNVVMDGYTRVASLLFDTSSDYTVATDAGSLTTENVKALGSGTVTLGARVYITGEVSIDTAATLVMSGANSLASTASVKGDGRLVFDTHDTVSLDDKTAQIGSIEVRSGTLTSTKTLQARDLTVGADAELSTNQGTILYEGGTVHSSGTVRISVSSGTTELTTGITNAGGVSGKLVKEGSGTLSVKSAVAAGTVQVDAGRVEVDNAHLSQFLPSVGTVVVNAGASAFLGQNAQTTSLTEIGTSFVVNGGTLQLALAQKGIKTVSGDLSVTNGGTLQKWDGGLCFTGKATLGASAEDHVTLLGSWGKDGTIFNGLVEGEGHVKLQRGNNNVEQFTFNHEANTFSGVIDATQGTKLVVGSQTALAKATSINLAHNSTMVLAADAVDIKSLNGSGSIDFMTTDKRTAATLNITEGGIFNGSIEAQISINKTGAGTLALNGATTQFSGDLRIEGGTVSLGSAAMDILNGATSVYVGNDTTLQLAASATAAGPMEIQGTLAMGGTIYIRDSVKLGDNFSIILGGDYQTVAPDTRVYTVFSGNDSASLSDWQTLDLSHFSGVGSTERGVAIEELRVQDNNYQVVVSTKNMQNMAITWAEDVEAGVWDISKSSNFTEDASGARTIYMEGDTVSIASKADITMTSAVNLEGGTLGVKAGADATIHQEAEHALTMQNLDVQSGGQLTINALDTRFASTANVAENGHLEISISSIANSASVATLSGAGVVALSNTASLDFGNKALSGGNIDAATFTGTLQLGNGTDTMRFRSTRVTGLDRGNTIELNDKAQFWMDNSNTTIASNLILHGSSGQSASASWGGEGFGAVRGATGFNGEVTIDGNAMVSGATNITFNGNIKGTGDNDTLTFGCYYGGQGNQTYTLSAGMQTEGLANMVVRQSGSNGTTTVNVNSAEGLAEKLAFADGVGNTKAVVNVNASNSIQRLESTAGNGVVNIAAGKYLTLAQGADYGGQLKLAEDVTFTANDKTATAKVNGFVKFESAKADVASITGADGSRIENTLIDLAAGTRLEMANVTLGASSCITDDNAVLVANGLTVEADILSNLKPLTYGDAAPSPVEEPADMVSFTLSNIQDVVIDGKGTGLVVRMVGNSSQELSGAEWMRLGLGGGDLAGQFADSLAVTLLYQDATGLQRSAQGVYTWEDVEVQAAAEAAALNHDYVYFRLTGTVPEPTTSTLSLLALAALAARRRRK